MGVTAMQIQAVYNACDSHNDHNLLFSMLHILCCVYLYVMC